MELELRRARREHAAAASSEAELSHQFVEAQQTWDSWGQEEQLQWEAAVDEARREQAVAVASAADLGLKFAEAQEIWDQWGVSEHAYFESEMEKIHMQYAGNRAKVW